MILFGIKENQSGFKVIKGHSCICCRSKESLFVQTRVQYFHIFRIPIFPYAKIVYSVCAECQSCLALHSMPPDLKKKALFTSRNSKNNTSHAAVLILLYLFN